MKRLFDKKRNVLILGCVSLLLLVVLVSGLRGLVFKPAVPFTIEQEQGTGGKAWTPPPFPWLAFLLVFAVLVVMIFILAPKDRRKRYLLVLLEFLAGIVLILLFISRSNTAANLPTPTFGFVRQLTPTATVTELPETPLPETAPSTYTSPVIPPWTSFVAALAVLVPLGLGLWWLFARRTTPEAPYEELSEIAQEALDDLDEGKDWGDTILNCYDSMTRTLKGRRGYERPGYLTPSEFVSALERVRLPGDPMRRLTTLFERVRYGGKSPTQIDIDEAVSCLTEIVEACQKAVP